MKRADEFGKGLWVRQQMFYAAISLQLLQPRPQGAGHHRQGAASCRSSYTPFKYVEDTYFQLSFGHLDGYSAVYYTYMWSLVIAKDLFTPFQAEGLMNPAPALRYRRAVLEPGGAKGRRTAGEGLPRPGVRLRGLRALAQRHLRRCRTLDRGP